MDLIGEERSRLSQVASWLDATPAEAAGLAVLLVGSVLATMVLAWTALGRPAALPADAQPLTSEAADVGTPAGHDDDAHDDPHAGDHGAASAGEHGPGEEEVTVHVVGAVAAPGLVTLPAGARVADAVDAVGGLLEDADPARANLARTLVDGEQIVVLREGEEGPAPPAGEPTGGDGTPAVLDLNTATAAQLQTLPGIGPALADRIVRHRETNGPFRQPGDLRDVSGIGEKRFQELAPLVTVR